MATIVVMDDDDVVRDVLVRVLKMRRYTVLPFSDAQPVRLCSKNFSAMA